MGHDANQKVAFNGIAARTGAYLLEPMSANEIVEVAKGNRLRDEPDGEQHLRDLELRKRSSTDERVRGVKDGIDASKLEQAGWGVIFPAVHVGTDEAREQAAIREALAPLLELRRAQATAGKGDYYREYSGTQGYRPGESKREFLARFDVGIGPADPERVPYYLLIVASPQVIPFRVQYQLDVQYAVGRIHFDTLEDYDTYARCVVAAEIGALRHARKLAFVGVANPDDMATQLSREQLVGPLADKAQDWHEARRWTIERYFDERADKAHVSRLYGGDETPALVFTASHGIGFDRGDPLQRRHQGALLLQDWPGPEQWQQEIGEQLYFGADDLRSDADMRGLISFNFACYGGGTPQYDGFSRNTSNQRPAIADEAFVAELHRKLLSHRKGGALASIAHIDRAWGCSFMLEPGRRGARPQLAVFESALRSLMSGMPVGMAVEYFNLRYAEAAADLSVQLEDLADDPESVDAHTLASLWTSNNDARGYGILGDPAVRLRFDKPGGRGRRAPVDAIRRGRIVDRDDDPAARVSTRVSLGSGSGAVTIEGDAESKRRLITEFTAKLVAALRKSGDGDDSSIEVRTYVSGDVGAGASRLCARTRVALDGEAEMIVEQRDGSVDPAVLDLHLRLVEQARAARAEAIAALLAAADDD